MNENTATNTPAPAPAPAPAKKLEFGNGRYSNFMKETASSLRNWFGFTEERAYLVARAIGSEYGRVLANAEAEVTLGKLGKNGALNSIREAAKIKGVVLTRALQLVKMLDAIDEAQKFGLECEQLQMDIDLQEWCDGLK